jgi:hypothetical protein
MLRWWIPKLIKLCICGLLAGRKKMPTTARYTHTHTNIYIHFVIHIKPSCDHHEGAVVGGLICGLIFFRFLWEIDLCKVFKSIMNPKTLENNNSGLKFLWRSFVK